MDGTARRHTRIPVFRPIRNIPASYTGTAILVRRHVVVGRGESRRSRRGRHILGRRHDRKGSEQHWPAPGPFLVGIDRVAVRQLAFPGIGRLRRRWWGIGCRWPHAEHDHGQRLKNYIPDPHGAPPEKLPRTPPARLPAPRICTHDMYAHPTQLARGESMPLWRGQSRPVAGLRQPPSTPFERSRAGIGKSSSPRRHHAIYPPSRIQIFALSDGGH